MVLRLAAVLLPLSLLVAACAGEMPEPVATTVPLSHVVTADSAGPIGPDAAYSSAALQRLFPDARLDAIRTADAGGVVDAIAVFEDGLQVFQVIPAGDGAIRAVHGTGLAVAGPNGERLGAAFAGMGVSRDACEVGGGPWAGMAVCLAPGTTNVRLVFDNGGWDGPSSELPPARVLGGAHLQRIVWTPPAGEA